MIDKALFLVYNIIVVMSEDVTGYMQTYRSGHNGADSKSPASKGSSQSKNAVKSMLPGFVGGAEGTGSLLNVSPKIERREQS